MTQKKQDKKKIDIIEFTKVLTVLLGLVTLAADVFSKTIAEYSVYYVIGENSSTKVYMLMAVIYFASVAAYALLILLFMLLNNLGKGKVFIKDNVKYLKGVGIGLLVITLASVVGAILVNSSIFLIGFIMLFVALIVFCVQLVIEKAIEMKDELDYTV